MIVSAPNRLDLVDQEGAYLRLTSENEIEKLYHAIDENREFLQEFQPWARTLTFDELKKSTSNRLGQIARGEWYQYWIIRPDTTGDTEVIGMVTLFNHDPVRHEAYLGYWLVERAQGHGYAYSAAKRLVEFGLGDLGLKQIKLNIRPENIRSEKLAERLGAHLSDELSEETVDGTSYPMRVWVIERAL